MKLTEQEYNVLMHALDYAEDAVIDGTFIDVYAEGADEYTDEKVLAILQSIEKKFIELNPLSIADRLDTFRKKIEAGDMSYSDIAELQGLADYIDAGDVQLLEWAGVEEK